MKRIIVDNFEMIRHQELTLDANLNILIGPQASGKSTLVKLIFFCLKLCDYVLEYMMDPRNFQNVPSERHIHYLYNHLRRKFTDYFGKAKRTNCFHVRFDFDVERERYVTLTPDEEGYLYIEFSNKISQKIKDYLRDSAKTYQTENSVVFNPFMYWTVNALNLLSVFYHDTEELIYVPAGRSALSLFSDTQSLNLFSERISAPFRDFVYLTQSVKERFSMSLEEMILNYQKLGTTYMNAQDARRAIPIIHSVLRGEYRKDNESEKLYYTDNDYVKLTFASSGQQEVLWILNLIFLKILENKRIFLVLEEPEAHLFPIAQKSVVDLIALLIHSTGSTEFITTHSPYILTSANLCAYSAKVENNPKLPKKRDDVVVPEYLRIPPEKYNAFMTPYQKTRSAKTPFLESIKDEESGVVDATRIDEISDILNGDMDRLIDLEVQYDL